MVEGNAMLKRIGLPIAALFTVLILMSPAKASAETHFGIYLGAPAYNAPAPYVYMCSHIPTIPILHIPTAPRTSILATGTRTHTTNGWDTSSMSGMSGRNGGSTNGMSMNTAGAAYTGKRW